MRLERTSQDGTKTYHYTAKDSNGLFTTFVRKMRDGQVIEDREARFDDLAGHSTATKRFGH